MIIAFDLDDTLYPEQTFVASGFRAVAEVAARAWGIGELTAFRMLMSSLRVDGRGRQFDELARRFGRSAARWVPRFVQVYRRHRPDIRLPRMTVRVLDELADLPLYLVTDGHKDVQQRKVDALQLASRFRRCYLTNRYGLRHQKPSPHVFQLIVRRERCRPSELVYVGNDPRKDFVGIRPLGFRTIRLRTRDVDDAAVPPQQEAELVVDTLGEVPAVVRSWSKEVRR